MDEAYSFPSGWEREGGGGVEMGEERKRKDGVLRGPSIPLSLLHCPNSHLHRVLHSAPSQ